VLTAIFRVLFVGPVARLTIRVVAWRLAFCRIKPSQIGRNEALASATKLAAGGRCAACGATGPLEADHYRPRWAGGAEAVSNLQALCLHCHTIKTVAEGRVRAFVRRARRRNGSGRFQLTAIMATHRWFLCGLAAFGLIDGAFGVLSWWWRLPAIVIFAIGLRWQMKRRARIAGEDNMVRFDADDERQRYASTTLGDHVAVTQRLNVLRARTRAAMIWFPGAYLLALFAAVLAGV
jgi:hypothetical protein